MPDLRENTTTALNIRPYRGRRLLPGQRVFAYRNLNQECWSLRAQDGRDRGRVVAHCDSMPLVGCEFIVQQAGRRRAVREGRRNVHAGIVGTVPYNLVFAAGCPILNPLVVRYNPRRATTFIQNESTPCVWSRYVHLGTDGKARIGNIRRPTTIRSMPWNPAA